MTLTNKEIKEWEVIRETLRRTSGIKAAEDFEKLRTTLFRNKSVQDLTTIEGGKVITDIILPLFKKNIDAYKETDRLMKLGTKISPGDDIYIDCRPTNTFGEEIKPRENIIDNIDTTNTVFNELSDSMDKDMFFNNIGFQAIIGIFLFGVVYYIGNYIFVKIPSKF